MQFLQPFSERIGSMNMVEKSFVSYTAVPDPDHLSRNADYRGVIGYVLEHHGIRADFYVIAHLDCSKDFCSGADDDVAADGRVPFASLFPCAAQSDPLEQRYIIPGFHRFTDHDSHSVIDEHTVPQISRRVDLDAVKKRASCDKARGKNGMRHFQRTWVKRCSIKA